MRPETPSLLVFALGAGREASRRRLLPGGARSLERRLMQRCLATAVEAGQAAGCEVVVSSPRPSSAPEGTAWLLQRGRTFGDRFRRALEEISGSRGKPVVAVGADVPGLRARHVRAGLARLEEAPESVVVGPSPDGGFYLLASAEPLDKELAGVAWRSPAALSTLLAALAASGRPVTLLEPLGDLDRRRDLELWLAGQRRGARSPFADLVRRLRDALRPLKMALAERPLRHCLVTAFGSRGPPA